MGKKTPKPLSAHDIEGFARQQNYMNAANVENAFGSTNTTFDANDQPTIVQSLSPEMQQQLDQQMNFLGQGPAQLGEYSPGAFMQSMMQGTGDSIARRGGYNPGDASMMGGYDSSNQQFQPSDPMQPDPMAPMDLPQQNGAPQVGNPQMPYQPQEQNNIGAALGQALSSAGGSGGIDPYSQMGENIAALIRRNQSGVQ